MTTWKLPLKHSRICFDNGPYIHPEDLMFYYVFLQLSLEQGDAFTIFVPIVATDSCCPLAELELIVVFCCCSLYTSRVDILCILWLYKFILAIFLCSLDGFLCCCRFLHHSVCDLQSCVCTNSKRLAVFKTAGLGVFWERKNFTIPKGMFSLILCTVYI